MWYYADGGRQVGPVDEAALDNLVRQGVVRDSTLVWREGMAAWQPHSTARPRPAAVSMPVAPPPAPAPVAAAAPAPAPAAQAAAPSAADMRYCAECGRPYPAQELGMVGTVMVCGTCRPAVMQRMTAAPPPAQAYSQPYGAAPVGAYAGSSAQAMMQGGYRYAGFWIRFLALFIDGIIVGIVSAIILLPLAFLGIGGAAGLGALADRSGDPSAALAILPSIMGLIGISFILRVVLFAGYEAYFLSAKGATPGKMALGLKVIRADGGPISIGLGAGRAFAMMLSGFILYIGFIMAGFDPEKRSLHDRICNTRVIYSR